jgi:hypothetical protein
MGKTNAALGAVLMLATLAPGLEGLHSALGQQLLVRFRDRERFPLGIVSGHGSK